MDSPTNIFDIPKQETQAPAVLAKLKPRAMQLWVDALPMTNLRATTRAVFARIETLITSELPSATLLDSLEILVARCHVIVAQLEERIRDKARPLAVEDLRIADLIYELRLKVYLGYKRVLHETRGERGARRLLHRMARRRAFHRAQEVLLELLRNRCLIYRPVPYFHWLEMHDNFEQACAEKCHAKPMQLIDNGGIRLSTEDLYKQALLFALASPHRFLPRDIQRLYLALRRWAGDCVIERMGPQVDMDRAPFFVDINLDKPPVHISAVDMSKPFAGWYIHTSGLVSRVASEMEAAEKARGGEMRSRPTNRLDVLPLSLLSSLLLAWGMGTRRQVQRTQSQRSLRIIAGISDLYTLLGGIPLPDGNNSAGFEMEVVGTFGGPKAQPAELHWHEELAEFEISVGGREGFGNVRIRSFLMCDASNGGMLICADDASESDVHVGELIGILDDPQARTISRIGAVRWMRLDRQNRQQCGVELLLHDPRCSQLRVSRKDGMVEYLPVIYQLPDDGQDNLLLITECFYAKPSDSFCWRFEGEEQPLSLSQLLECTGAYSLFQLPLDSIGDDTDSRRRDVHPADYFDDIWNRL